MFRGVHVSPCNPIEIAKIIHYEISCRALEKVPDLVVVRNNFKLTEVGDWNILNNDVRPNAHVLPKLRLVWKTGKPTFSF